ncbi:MAG: DUF4426 domain-containing protein [Porticoccaceae bacterium]|nr:DUF4426 domain-containing protein [Porticoccaceae bacterium]
MKLKLILALACCLGFAPAHAQTDISKDFGDYRVYYSVFNSSFITPEIAALYGLTRGSNRALVNISLIRTSADGDSLGLPAQVSGTARNLIMQNTPLNFVEIDEGDVTYYLASFRFDDQDPLHFDIEVNHEDTRVPHKLSFTRTLYAD